MEGGKKKKKTLQEYKIQKLLHLSKRVRAA